jgi:hypothetical protein
MPEGDVSVPPQRNPGIEEAPLQTELMLFDPESSKFFVLNSTMAFLWKNADGTRSVDQLTEMMSAAFRDADAAQIASDVARAAAEMRDLGLFVDTAQQDL